MVTFHPQCNPNPLVVASELPLSVYIRKCIMIVIRDDDRRAIGSLFEIFSPLIPSEAHKIISSM